MPTIPNITTRFPKLAPKIEEARTAGHSEEAIGDFVRGKISESIKAGYSAAEVTEFLTGDSGPSLGQKIATGPVGDFTEGALDSAAAPIEAVTAAGLGMATAISRPLMAASAFIEAPLTGQDPRVLEKQKLEAVDKAIPVYEPQSRLARTAVETISSPFERAGAGLEHLGVSPETAQNTVETAALFIPGVKGAVRGAAARVKPGIARTIDLAKTGAKRGRAAFQERFYRPEPVQDQPAFTQGLRQKEQGVFRQAGSESIFKERKTQEAARPPEGPREIDLTKRPEEFTKADLPKPPIKDFPGPKLHQPVPEIKTVALEGLKRREGSETASVSQEVAAKMDFTEPIKVSVFSDGEMRISDGHHRVAAANQLGIKRLPVEIQAINTPPEFIQRLIEADRAASKAPAPVSRSAPSVEGPTPEAARPPVEPPRPAAGGPTPALIDIVQRVADAKRVSPGEMRELRDAGLAKEFPDHSFALTEAGRGLIKRPEAPKPKVEPKPETKLETEAIDEIETEIGRVAKTEGQRPAKEVKTELISRLETALKKAPVEGDTKINLKIPDDGTFRILNTKSAIERVLKEAKRIGVTQGPRRTKFKIPIPKPTGRVSPEVFVDSNIPTDWVPTNTGIGKGISFSKGQKVEVPGYEGIPLYLVSEGTDFRIVEPRTGFKLAARSGTAKGAIENAVRQLKERDGIARETPLTNTDIAKFIKEAIEKQKKEFKTKPIKDINQKAPKDISLRTEEGTTPRGTAGLPAESDVEVTAFHGTAAKFEAFDTAKIGTGEGAQSFGHGLYFAENLETARTYARSIASSKRSQDFGEIEYFVNGKKVKEFNKLSFVEQEAIDLLANSDSPTTRANRIRARQGIDADYPAAQINAAMEKRAGQKITTQDLPPSENLYSVTVPKKAVDNMLDWDKPLSKQTPEIQEIIKGIRQDRMIAHPDLFPDPTGKQIYNELVTSARDAAILRGENKHTTLPAAQAKASQDLADFGIPGIKYLDQGSRGHKVILRTKPGAERYADNTFDTKARAEQYAAEKQVEGFTTEITQEGTRNLVVFDPKTLTKTERLTRDMIVESRTKPQKAPKGTAGLPQEVKGQGGDPMVKHFDPPAIKTDSVVKRSELISELQEGLDVPIRVGRMGVSRKTTRAFFKIKEEVIRSQDANDFEGIAHESGHFLSKKILGYKFTGAARNRAFDQELVKMGKELYGDRKPNHGYAEEGVAEFVRFYVINPQKALAKAPKFHAFFEDLVSNQFPDVKSVLIRARESWVRYNDQPATARVLAQMSIGEKASRSFNLDDLYTATLDDLHPIKVFTDRMTKGKAPLNALDDPYILGRLSRGWVGKVQSFLKDGTLDFKTLEINGPALDMILGPIEGQLNNFRAYALSRRTIELAKRDMRTGVTAKDAAEVVRELDSPAMQKAFDGLQDYQDAGLQYLRDSGMLGEQSYAKIKALNENYIPLYRIVQDSEVGTAGHGRTFANLHSPVKRIKGSTRDIIDPIESIIKNTYTYLNLAERNSVGQALVKMGERFEGAGKFVEKVPTGKVPIGIKGIELESIIRKHSRIKETKTFQTFHKELTKEIGGPKELKSAPVEKMESVVRDALTSRGFSEGEATQMVARLKKAKTEGDVATIIEKIVEDQTVVTLTKEMEFIPPAIVNIFRPNPKVPGMDNIVAIYRNGERTLYQLSPDLYKAMLALDRESSNLLIRFVSLPAKSLRVGATVLSPEFAIRNPIKDQWSAWVFSKYNYFPPVDAVKGLFHVVKRDAVYQKFLAGGGLRASLVSLDRPEIYEAIRNLRRARGPKGVATHIITHPIDTVRVLAEIGEEVTRVGEFAKGLRKEGATKEGMLRAAFSSREVTVDFGRMGAKTAALNQMTAFFNAHLQGIDRIVRGIKDNKGRVLTRSFIGITLPSILLYLANRDDPRYTELARWQKDLFWIIPMGDMTTARWKKMSPKEKEAFNRDHTVYRIPKPFELGLIFGSVPERALEYLETEDPKALDELWNSIKNGFGPNILPTFSVAPIENFANYSRFRERPIVSRSKENLRPSEQFGTYTSETAKLIGKAFNYSPSKIDNIIRGWFGGGGRLATEIIDPLLTPKGAPTEPQTRTKETVGLRGLVARFPGQPQSVEDFYDELNEAREAKATLAKIKKEGRTEEAKAYQKENQEAISNLPRLNFARKQIADDRKQIDRIRASKLSPEQKRRRIDTLIFRMADRAKGVLKGHR